MHKLWIDNQWTDAASDETIAVIDPATEAEVGRVPAATPADVDRAMRAAQAAFAGWRHVSAAERAELLHEVARRMRQDVEALAVTLTHETGRLLDRNRRYVGWSADVFDYYAEMGRNSRGRVIPSVEPSQLALVLKEPYGVVACIVPWNYPMLLLTWKIAPALAAGNSVVIKPASQTPLATLALARCFEHLPPGVVNIVTGRGSTVGDALVTHPATSVVAFTGSTEVGQRIAGLAAERMTKLHLELGGKDPCIVAADADIRTAAMGVAWGAFVNAGQVCTSIERVYVERPVYRDFCDCLAELTARLRVGSPFDPDTQITPLIGGRERDAILAQIEQAAAQGARIVAGGRRPPQLERGYFLEPTVLVDVPHAALIMREETFGPVAPVAPVESFDEALALANDSRYGLGASLFTHDPTKAKRFYEEVKAGTIWINDPLIDNIAGPFGGMKQSGIGRELGEEGLEEFLETKHIHWDFEMQPKPWWYPYGET
ncbi:MAG TPA: aldehyde dehydrogenase family protein [Herpetosiphonaceae bacterium]